MIFSNLHIFVNFWYFRIRDTFSKPQKQIEKKMLYYVCIFNFKI
jgi:hypothetical protein